jgi:hypothetical protein
MGFELRRFPEHDLALRIVSGPTTVEDVIRFYQELDPSHGSRWLTYIDPNTTAETGDVVPVARIPELRRAIAGKMEELFGGRQVASAVVCVPGALESLLNFWRAYSDAGEAHPIHPALFPTLEAAYDWLDLPEAARVMVTGAVEERIRAEKPPPAGRDAQQGSHAPLGAPGA